MSKLFQRIYCSVVVTALLIFSPISNAQSIRTSGTIVDDVTGEAIKKFEIETGYIDDVSKQNRWVRNRQTVHADESDGSFQTTIRRQNGRFYRARTEGYFPSATWSQPTTGNDQKIQIRLKPGLTIKGQVLDHEGNPVVARVIELNRRIDLGERSGQEKNVVRQDKIGGTTTDNDGKFELRICDSDSLLIACDKCLAWVHPLGTDLEKRVTIRLPEMPKVNIRIDIKGAEDNGQVFYQLLTYQMDGFHDVELTDQIMVENRSSISIHSLPPGRYQFCRKKMLNFANIGRGAMLDRQFVQIKPGEDVDLDFVRTKGSQIFGRIQIPKADVYSGIRIIVKGNPVVKDPFGTYESLTELESCRAGTYDDKNILVGTSAPFVTELLPPGEYTVVAEGYLLESDNNARLTGFRPPSTIAEKKVTIGEDGKPVKLQLRFAEPKPASISK